MCPDGVKRGWKVEYQDEDEDDVRTTAAGVIPRDGFARGKCHPDVPKNAGHWGSHMVVCLFITRSCDVPAFALPSFHRCPCPRKAEGGRVFTGDGFLNAAGDAPFILRPLSLRLRQVSQGDHEWLDLPLRTNSWSPSCSTSASSPSAAT